MKVGLLLWRRGYKTWFNTPEKQRHEKE